MKKFLWATLILLYFTACGSQTQAPESTTEPTSDTTTTAVSETVNTSATENNNVSTEPDISQEENDQYENYKYNALGEVTTSSDPKKAAEKTQAICDSLKAKYPDRVFVSYDNAYAVVFPDKQWGGTESDTTTVFTKGDMQIDSTHFDDFDVSTFGNIKDAIPTTSQELSNKYSSSQDTKNYKVIDFEFAEGDYNRMYALSETGEEEPKYLIACNIASENNAFIISGYCNDMSEAEEIKDIIVNGYYIF